MTENTHHIPPFDPPSFLFRLEDLLKSLYGGSLLYNDFIRKMDLQGEEHVLDFGCGGGVEARCVLKQLSFEGQVTCLDPSEYLLNRAKKRLKKYPNVTFYNQDIREVDFPPDTFDAVIIFHVLHDIPKADRGTIVAALCSTLKSTGKIFIREPIRTHHGMPLTEIRALFQSSNLTETQNEMVNSNEYWGVFQTQTH